MSDLPTFEAKLWRVNLGTIMTVVPAVTKEDAAAIARARFESTGHHCHGTLRPRPATRADWLAYEQRLAAMADLEVTL